MRVALYFSPSPGGAWWRFGARWLGRDPAWVRPGNAPGAAAYPAWPSQGWSEAQRTRLATEPRRYGFHATLVAPFRLAAGARIEDVSDAARDFAARHEAVRGVALHVSEEAGFVALRPAHASPAVDALAFDAVRHFDPLRAPLDAAERERRARGLDARQRQLLDRWGYGRVADQYRFHLTLTDKLDAAERTQAAEAARRVLAAQGLHAIDVDGLSIFVEGEDRVFRMVQWRELAIRPGAARP
mgnify:CR=1 FL=1